MESVENAKLKNGGMIPYVDAYVKHGDCTRPSGKTPLTLSNAPPSFTADVKWEREDHHPPAGTSSR